MHETTRGPLHLARLHRRAIVAVLRWPCRYWHHPGDDDCFGATSDEGLNELAWRWARIIPRRLWGALDR